MGQTYDYPSLSERVERRCCYARTATPFPLSWMKRASSRSSEPIARRMGAELKAQGSAPPRSGRPLGGQIHGSLTGRCFCGAKSAENPFGFQTRVKPLDEPVNSAYLLLCHGTLLSDRETSIVRQVSETAKCGPQGMRATSAKYAIAARAASSQAHFAPRAARAYLGVLGLRLFAAARDVLDVTVPALGLEPVAGEKDLRASKVGALDRVCLHRSK